MRRICSTALGISLALGAATTPASAVDECPSPFQLTEGESATLWDAIYTEFETMEPVYNLDFRIGGQPIFRTRTRADISSDDPIAGRLRALKPRLEALLSEVGSTAGRPVMLMESRTDTLDETLAFVVCENADDAAKDGSLMRFFLDGKSLPNGACLMVVYPNRVGDGDEFDFVLSHEWMHTRQHGAYGGIGKDSNWRTEGGADWFAHKAFPGFAKRDEFIAQFFDDQRVCALNQMSYPAQVFFFWFEKLFEARLAFELGIFLDGNLSETAHTAELLPPERWLDWAKAQADASITFPDGRDLSASIPVEPIDIGSACRAVIEGPPLSAQVRAAEFPPSAEGPLRVETNGAQVALRQEGGDWVDVPDGATIDPVPVGPVTIAAIQPDADDLSVRLSLGDDAEDLCSCYVGRWMELPAGGHSPSDLYEFRDDATDAFVTAMLAADGEMQFDIDHFYEGPVLTISADGTYRIDDPKTVTAIDLGTGSPVYYEGDFAWRLTDVVRQHYGTWSEENGLLKLQSIGRRTDYVLISLGTRFSEQKDKRRRALGDVWIPDCDGGQLKFYSQTAGALLASGTPPDPLVVFRKALAP